MTDIGEMSRGREADALRDLRAIKDPRERILILRS